MNVNINNNNHNISFGLGKGGILKASVDGSEKMSFEEVQEKLASKANNDEERDQAMNFMQLPEEFLQRGLARMTKSRIFDHKWELAKTGNIGAANDIKNLFSRFGLERFLTRNMDNNNNFVTNLVNMTQREREAFLKMEEYIFNGGRV